MRQRYVTSSRLVVLEATLSDRDRAVLATVDRVRVASATQLERLHGMGITRRQLRAVLASLTDRRLLGRLPRRVGGVRAGSAGFVYALDVAGQRLAHPVATRTARPWPVGLPFLRHSLDVTETYVRLVEAERAGRLRLAEFVTEPRTWRPFVGPGGERMVLKPDAAATIHVDGYEDRWFLEVDRGTEATTAVARQCDRYRHHWASGQEQVRFEVFPRVLWLVPDQRRYEQLVDVLGRQPVEAWALFGVSRFEDVVDRLVQGAAS